MGLVAAVCIYVVMHVVKYTHITYILRYGFIQKYIKTEESHNNGSVKLGAISASVSVSFASYSHLGCLLTRSFNTMIKNNNTRIHIMLFFSPSPISLHHLLVYICLLAHFNPSICTACTVYNIVDTLYTSINGRMSATMFVASVQCNTCSHMHSSVYTVRNTISKHASNQANNMYRIDSFSYPHFSL